MTTSANAQIVPVEPAAVNPALRAADRGVADALESVLSDNTRRVYGTQWRIFDGWCDEVGLVSLPAEPLTVARYLAARAGSGASSIATMRLATSAISKAHEWAKLESPCRDPGVRASLKGWGRRLAKPQRQSGALTAVLAVIRLTAVQPRKRGRGIRDPPAGRGTGQVRSGPGGRALRRRAAPFRGGRIHLGRRAALGRRIRPHHRNPFEDRRGGPGCRGGHHPRRHAGALRHPAGGRWRRGEGVRAVGVPDRPAGQGDRQRPRGWRIGSSSAATAGGLAWPGAWPRTAPPPTRSSARAAGSRAAAWSAATPAASPRDQRCGICSSVMLSGLVNLSTLVVGVVADGPPREAMPASTNRRRDFASSANYRQFPGWSLHLNTIGHGSAGRDGWLDHHLTARI